ncbi:MAG: phosphoserine phosphatase SerB [Planctomycetota bacterium]
MPDAPPNTPIYLLRFRGDDRPGVTAALTDALAQQDAEVLDINQAVIHNVLVLGMMVRLPSTAPDTAFNSVEQLATTAGLHMRVKPVPADEYDAWVAAQGKPRYILTLLARAITAADLAAVTHAIADHGLNITVLHRLSGRAPRIDDGSPKRACVELQLRGQPTDYAALQAQLIDVANQHGIDLAIQADNAFRRTRRLVVFDMDSTLIQAEVIDELAKEAGVGDRVARITEAAMAGEIDFDESLRQRVATLQGLPVSTLEKVAQRLQLTEGAPTLLANLRRLGYTTAILSGGFTHFGEHLQSQLGIDRVHANVLEIDNNHLTGRVVGPIINGPRKADLLRSIANELHIDTQQVVAIGDGANDLPMLAAAGLGIAFHAKPLVQQTADHRLSTLGLDAVLYLLGLRDRELA